MEKKKFKCYRFDILDVVSSKVLYSAFDEIFDRNFLELTSNCRFKNLSDILNTVEEKSSYTIFNVSMTDRSMFFIFKLKEEEKNL